MSLIFSDKRVGKNQPLTVTTKVVVDVSVLVCWCIGSSLCIPCSVIVVARLCVLPYRLILAMPCIFVVHPLSHRCCRICVCCRIVSSSRCHALCASCPSVLFAHTYFCLFFSRSGGYFPTSLSEKVNLSFHPRRECDDATATVRAHRGQRWTFLSYHTGASSLCIPSVIVVARLCVLSCHLILMMPFVSLRCALLVPPLCSLLTLTSVSFSLEAADIFRQACREKSTSHSTRQGNATMRRRR